MQGRGLLVEYVKEQIPLVKEKKKSKLTVRQYYYRIKQFLQYLNERGLSIDQITDFDVKKFIESADSKYEERMRCYAVKDFLEFVYSKTFYENLERILKSAEISKYSPFRTSVLCDRIKPKYGLTVEEMKKIVELTEFEPSFQAGLVCSMWFGWRPIEATVKLRQSLKKELIDFEGRKVTIETAKRKDPDRWRVIPFPELLDDYFRYWCRFVQRLYWKNSHMYLITRCRRWYDKFLKEIGKPVSPVIIRRTVETELQIRQVPQPVIDYFIGHKLRAEILENMIEHRPMAERYVIKQEICERVIRPELEKKHFLFEVLR